MVSIRHSTTFCFIYGLSLVSNAIKISEGIKSCGSFVGYSAQWFVSINCNKHVRPSVDIKLCGSLVPQFLTFDANKQQN
jgi:hypothetical protein